jgi:serine/threonine-protein kinase
MTQPDRCPDCGAERHAGICPRCLIRLGIDGPGPGRSSRSQPGDPTGLGGGPTLAGVLETLAASIGPVPRVLLRDTAPGEPPGPILRPPADDDHNPSIRFRIDGEIARGGMGTVLKGRDPDLGRDVALKVLREDRRDDDALVRRFIEEAQIGGQLQHPGIVPIYELGTFPDSRPFFSMKLVKGRTLAQMLEDRKDPDDDRPRLLSVFEAIAQTVAYAHARGVIHRDLKPSNVMVGSFGEVQVMDWGLAKVLPRGGVADDEKTGQPDRQETVIATARSGSDAPGLSRPGSAMGTPAYMAPEQARGEGDRVDERADVFALGSMLCEVLTGEPAFLGRSSGEILRKAALGDTADALACLDACGADAELVAIARDCLARESEDRPRHAGAVAERITAHLAGVQDRLRAAELARAAADARAAEERKRRRLALAFAATVLCLVIVGGIGIAVYQEQRRDASARLAFALSEATMRRSEAQFDARADPARWQGAMAAANRARSLLGPLIDAASRRQVLALADQIAAESHTADEDRILLSAVRGVRWTVADQRAGAPGDALYAAAFRGAGLDVDALGPEAAGARIRAKPEELALDLLAALDDWALRRRRARPDDREGWGRLLAAARAADRDRLRNQVREVWEQRDRQSRDARLLTLASQADPNGSPESLRLLADALAEADLNDAAVALIHRAFQQRPRDVWLNYRLARLLEAANPPRVEEAIGHDQVAWASRPELGHALAHALEGRGRGDEARAVLLDLARVVPGPNPRHSLCQAWYDRPASAHSDALNRKFLEQGAEHFRALLRESKGARAEAGYRTSLGSILLRLGRLQEAIAEYRKASRLQPDDAGAEAVGDNTIAASKDSPGSAQFNMAFSVALAEVRDYQGALAECRTVLRLRPHDVTAHQWLASLQLSMGDTAAALGSIRKALAIDPGHIGSRATLSHILLASGRFVEAVPALEQAATRMAAVGRAEASARIKGLIPEVGWLTGQVDSLRDRDAGALKGREQPEAPEWAEYAAVHGRPALAARLYGAVLTAIPARGDDRKSGIRLRAARAAALAGCGKGDDDPRPDEAARAGLRKHAMEWLRAELNLWTKNLDSGTEAARGEVREALLRWKADPDLAGLRDPEALAKLPADEQSACRKLWADVDALLARFGGDRPEPNRSPAS